MGRQSWCLRFTRAPPRFTSSSATRRTTAVPHTITPPSCSSSSSPPPAALWGAQPPAMDTPASSSSPPPTSPLPPAAGQPPAMDTPASSSTTSPPSLPPLDWDAQRPAMDTASSSRPSPPAPLDWDADPDPDDVSEHAFPFLPADADRRSSLGLAVRNCYATTPHHAVERFPSVQAADVKGKLPWADFRDVTPDCDAAAPGCSLHPVAIASMAPSSPAPDDNWRDWAALTYGPAGLIAERLLADDVADYLRFRAVCRPWRQCSVYLRAHCGLDRRFHPRRWTMLRPEDLAAPYRRSFLNTSTGQCVQIDIPELHDHELLVLASDGLLVLVHDRQYIRLLNPFTRHLTELPPLAAPLPWRDHRRHRSEQYPYPINSFAAWGSGGVADDESTFVLCFGKPLVLGVARPGDDRWRLVPVPHESDGITAPVMFAGRFYCISRSAIQVLRADADLPRLEVAAELMNIPGFHSLHLVDHGGEMMLVRRQGGFGHGYDMYRVDLDAGTLVPVRSLGSPGRALFMGLYSSVSVPLEVFPSSSIRADTIYLSFDFPERNRKVRGYNLADRRVERPCGVVPPPHTLVDTLSLATTVGDYLTCPCPSTYSYFAF